MGVIVNARKLVGNGFPPEEGTKLSALLMARNVSWDELAIDARDLPSSLLISAFFNGFLQNIHEQNPALLEQAKKVKWILSFQFQEENVSRWMCDFKPFDRAAQGRVH